ncbi:Redoxin [Truncatella angustata]|uniref:Redoxin n=1 Tax=Truncatella angustata TaxID=152316 RepID=A0A9P8ZTV2_9PEZI|nr:Redoxin [Truncatella angustata]KAH6648727.1 Redoxin [Truncatella angustata]
MSSLVGKPFPEGVTFTYVPPSPDKSEVTACGIPVKFDASKELKDKKAIIVAVPGAFTPTCQADHLSGFIKKFDQLKGAGADLVIFIAYNDPFVMSAWGKANGIVDDKILFMSDDNIAFSSSVGWTMEGTGRTARYALIVDKGIVTYAEKESQRGVDVSGVDAILAKL